MGINAPLALSFPLVLLLLFSSTSTAAQNSATSNATDQAPLLSFKSRVSDDPLGALTSWGNQSIHLCQWPGVTCGNPLHPERVTALVLDSLNLAGSLSPSIANLTFLHTIYLPNNRFSGSIPPELGRLSRLRVLFLSNNSFTGEIPVNLSRCQNLRALDLDTNMLVGKIPNELGSLPSLVKMNLYTNNFTGPIPASLGNLSSLVLLDLSENSLEGNIPDSLARLGSLGFLQLSINRLSGELSPSLCNSSSVYYFDLGSNQLYGSLPPDIGSHLPIIRKLYLYSNSFEGSIPVSLANASRLERLGIEGNGFKGVVPSELGTITSMSWLALGNNRLVANEDSDWRFLDALTNCSNLQVLEISDNLFGGRLPGSIANLSTQLEWLSMEDNQISGTIPADMGRYVNLTFLSMFNNLLSGSIPANIGRLQSLNILRLLGNRLSGEIPSSIGNLTQLIELNLGGNGFEGSIPPSLGSLTNLNLLNLSCNKLTGLLPSEVVSLSSLTRYLDISHNSLTGSLPSEVGQLNNLLGLNISENRLSGKIPSSLGQCQVLSYLYMEGNLFEGSIPSSLTNLKGIQELDLSRNNLSGQIPEFLAGFQYLEYLNLSFNDLEGEVPIDGIFQNVSEVSLVGNRLLCGANKQLHLQPCSTEIPKRRHSSLAIKVVISISVAISIFLLLGLFAFYCRVKILSKRSQFRTSSVEENSRVSYAELFKATNGFSAENLIGAGSFGSVYRGIMGSDEMVVAVKVLNLQQRGASQSFLAECEALRNTRHRNLVKILTSCESIDSERNDFRALVFEYMPNGSLEEWLHPEAKQICQSRSLSFVQRLNIAIDVASALDYLHHYAHIPIVHCDLKPSNVLLDADMVAHVSDFGLARALSATNYGLSKNPSSSIVLKGSIGYVAPEYGMSGRVSTQGDVYSFGILLLEMLTGRRPTDEAFKEGLSLRKCVEMDYPDRVMDIVDQDLLYEVGNDKHNVDTPNSVSATGSIEECLVSVIGIALSCSKESQRERREMGSVVEEMLATRDMFLGEKLKPLDSSIVPKYPTIHHS